MIYMNVRDALKEIFVDQEAEWVELKVADYDEYLGIARSYDDALCKFSKYLDIEAIDYYHQSHYGFLMIINDKQYFDLLWKEEHKKDKQVKTEEAKDLKPLLDERIIKGKRPLCGFDFEEAKKYIGTNGYFGNDVSDFFHINVLKFDTLRHINSYDGSFTNQSNGSSFSLSYKYFLPESYVKMLEECYRPYSAKEFIEKFEFKLGYVIRLREKSNCGLSKYEYKTVFTGYRSCGEDIEVFLNGKWYTLHTLFGSLEYMENDEWRPFGIRVEGDV